MNRRHLWAILPALAMALILVASAVPAATMSNEQLVATRVAMMKENGRILRGAKRLDGAEAVAAANTVLKNFTTFPSLFPQGSLTPESRATAKIWENWADFTKRMAEEKASAQAMLKAAKAGDKDAYEAAISALTRRCSSCHLTYGR